MKQVNELTVAELQQQLPANVHDAYATRCKVDEMIKKLESIKKNLSCYLEDNIPVEQQEDGKLKGTAMGITRTELMQSRVAWQKVANALMELIPPENRDAITHIVDGHTSISISSRYKKEVL